VLGDPGIHLDDVTHDSRNAGPAVLFVAVRGASHDGHDFVTAAVEAGSPAVAVEQALETPATQIVVGNTRSAMGPMAATVHGEPSTEMSVVGVTGTNGKTTVTHYVESLMSQSGHVAGLIGTVYTRIGETLLPSVRTTPEATDFQRLLAEMLGLGAEVVAAEVSSHALEMSRVAGTRFEVAAFTNFSQDHLDFHGTMEKYRRAKERLFREFEVGTAVVNVADPVGAEIAAWASMPVITVGRGGSVQARSLSTSLQGASFELVTDRGSVPVRSGLIGAFNVENALVAAGCCLALGLTVDEIGEGMARLGGVPGRFEQVSGESPVHVFVDYAHTPGGVEEAISVARSMAEGRVIALVGAGGDRDREKRPMMGRAATTADFAVLTSDNPRSEDPTQILAEVASGARGQAVTLEVNRDVAIEKAIGMAVPGDVVLILGKGHETGQEVKGEILPFDDREIARQVIANLGRSAGLGQNSGSMTP
jgi:UDP-N-acetylmuramoyl-L-alanyl-D-glutamate--2,6-diaminopimelate ligase